MKQAAPYFAGLKRSVRRLLPRPPAARPDLHQTALLRRLTGAAGGGHPEGAAVAYFADAAAGFLTVADVPQVLADYTRREAGWRAALLDEAKRQCRLGLPVYAALAGPLEGGLDWSARIGGAQGDGLYQLRPHRFGFVPRLAMAAACGADVLPALLATLDGWIARVDEGSAADAYFSNLVVIYRVVAISWAAPFCVAMARRGDATAALICLRLFQILAADVQFLRPRLGDSVANNHLLADRFAAWFLATCYPGLLPGSDTPELQQIWTAELCRQFQEDGTSFEQSVHYHELGCEMASAYIAISLRQGKRPPEAALARIRQMLRFQAALADERGNSFALGDSTDDPLLPLDMGTGPAGGAWRIVYRALFDGSFAATRDTARGAERAFWLLATLSGIEKPLRLAAEPAPCGQFAMFPDGGYVAIRDQQREQLLLFRTGPRDGAPVHPGHSMSDLLSVYWSVAGHPVLEPSGTYAYAAEAPPGRGPRFPRDYFRSPAAHNGVVLRGHDPLGKATGRFRGSDSGARVTTRWRAMEHVAQWAEGRLDETGPLNGHRRGVLHVTGRYTVVYDRLPPLPEKDEVFCHWQLAPEAEVAIADGGQASVTIDGLSIFHCADAAISCVRGESDPPGGWVSRGYGLVEAAPQLIRPARPGQRDLAAVLGVAAEGAPPPELDILAPSGDGLLLAVRQAGHLGIACIGNGAVTRDALPFDLEFDGDVVWLDGDEGTCREVRALGLRRFRSSSLGLDLAAGAAGGPARGEWQARGTEKGDAGVCGRWVRRGHG